MITVMKKKGSTIRAYRLGEGSGQEQEMIRRGLIVKRGSEYEIFSRESCSGTGEIVKAGDYFKIDEGGMPYPNSKEWFEKNHRHIKGDLYEQLPITLTAWQAGDPDDGPVRTLIDEGRLSLCGTDPEHFFQADMWGTKLSAPKDAVLVIYDYSKREFNFVARRIFDNTYEIVKKQQNKQT